MLVGLGLVLQLAATEVQMGKQVRPETVTVGQHFAATVRVRAAAGSTFRFPLAPDTSAAVDTAARSARVDANGAGYSEATMTYVLAAWDTGPQRLGLTSVTVSTPRGDRVATIGDMMVYVRSVLPGDTALRKPKPYRPSIAVRSVDFVPYLLAALALAVIAALIWLWRRWRQRASQPLSALEWAEREFARIESSGRIDSGQPDSAAIEASGVLRGYLSRAVPELRPSLTTRELAIAASNVNSDERAVAVSLLERADLLKFARATTSAESAREQLESARATVRAIDAALRAREAASQAARAKAA